ncbi:MAG: hypothetical protein IPK82_08870 [Polyangiaceae bacterium]|nr:hypothetical protein [Polyangiaceae bacterium]
MRRLHNNNHTGCIQNNPALPRGIFIALLAAFFTGCGAPSVKDICETYESEECGDWDGKTECIAAGNAIDERVDAAGGCDGAFDDYRRCLSDEKSCDFSDICQDERASLEACIGPL